MNLKIIIIENRNKEIYLLHYPKGQKMHYSSGFLKQITEDKDEIIHSCKIELVHLEVQ